LNLRFPFLCGTEVVKTGMLALFLILEEELIFQPQVCFSLCFFHIWLLLCGGSFV
jgi:hypothetical protein